jgi:hypothetical protein
MITKTSFTQGTPDNFDLSKEHTLLEVLEFNTEHDIVDTHTLYFRNESGLQISKGHQVRQPRPASGSDVFTAGEGIIS